ncbi:hypothetical protein BsWGS_14923 [Bradybaena similaris]
MRSLAVYFVVVMWLIQTCFADPAGVKDTDSGDGMDSKAQRHTSKCMSERRDAVTRRHSSEHSEVLVPECNVDGSYNEIQCHKSSGYCWCVTRDGRHVPGTSVKDMRPRCTSKRKKRKGDIRRRRACSSQERQTFNSDLVKVFQEEYNRVNITSHSLPATSGQQEDVIGTEKAIIIWKFQELDANKDGKLKFKEVRNFGKMVKKLIKPKACAKLFLDFCDKNTDRSIDKAEWTLCLGVDIKPSALDPARVDPSQKPVDDLTKDLLMRSSSTLLQTPDLPVVSSGALNSASRTDRQEHKESTQNCKDERDAAINIHSQEPAANHYIPTCTSAGKWDRTQCHQSTGYCWCVQEDNGNPIPGTATYKGKPQCTFENEREMKGCPFEQKRKFLVDLLSDLAEDRKKSLLESSNKTSVGSDDSIPIREAVARWKFKMLDASNNGILERKEWRPFRRTTLKNKNYSRKCRRSFLRYCDIDNNQTITSDEWKECLGLNQNNFNSLPLNRRRKGKNSFSKYMHFFIGYFEDYV